MLTVSPLQIKNMVAAASALAMHQNTKVSLSHLEMVINLSEEFESDFGKDSNKHSYL
jgi:predicted ATP-dependent protease